MIQICLSDFKQIENTTGDHDYQMISSCVVTVIIWTMPWSFVQHDVENYSGYNITKKYNV